MNKNTIIAILLIILSVQFFTSKFYYEKILKKPYIFHQKPEQNLGKEAISKQQEQLNAIQPENNASIQSASHQKTLIPYQDSLSEIKTNDSAYQHYTPQLIKIETDKIICVISEKGANIVSIKTKEYSYNGKFKHHTNENDFIELIPQHCNGGANLTINNKNYDASLFKVESDKSIFTLGSDDSITISFVFSKNSINQIIKTFTFYKNSYKIGMRIQNLDLIGQNIHVGWSCGISESQGFSQYNQRTVHLFDGQSVEHLTVKKKSSVERTGYYKWVGLTSKYFLIAMVTTNTRDMDVSISGFSDSISTASGQDDKDKTAMNYTFSMKQLSSANDNNFWFYAGPTKINELKRYGIDLNKVLFKGYRWFFWADKWFPPLCEFVLWLLIELQKFFKDYGIVIIVLTILLKIATFPLSISSTNSANKMKELQPKIAKIREKYKNNPKKMNQKIMEFYKEEGLNPLGSMSGCLPLILQTPIFISLYMVLSKAIELRGQGTFLVPWVHDLSQAEILFSLGFTIPFYGNSVAFLPILMAILMYFQNKLTIKDPNQKAIIYMMPIIMLFMFNNFPSGLSLYFVFSTALQIVQQIGMEWWGKNKKNSTSPKNA